jgi:beta-lactamase superfamily II metal-dependent hydrolase
MFKVEMLPANEGDALWVEYGDPDAPHRFLIDCGYKNTYRTVLERFEADPALELELFLLTHIDADHIAGAVPFIADARVTPQRVRDVWFNGRSHILDLLGVEQAEYFTHHLTTRGFSWNTAFGGNRIAVGASGPPESVPLPGGMLLTILSPGTEQLRALADHWTDELEDVLRNRHLETVDELVARTPPRLQPDVLGDINVEQLAETPFVGDDKAPNGSSIAVLAEYHDVFDGGQHKAVLFTGDAFAPVVADSLARLFMQRGIEKLPLTALKVSHHGSAGNTSAEFLKLLDCKKFLISTNGTRHEHPDRECVARVIKSTRNAELYFNYTSDFNVVWAKNALQRDHRYTAHYPDDGVNGLVADL